mmetsp:Transcript_13989/g.47230  ORF Transcript_13989/g.47230 Transcript_13989/m.47230 type:complete len:474 (-) Transcript_13989:113-1534(-)
MPGGAARALLTALVALGTASAQYDEDMGDYGGFDPYSMMDAMGGMGGYDGYGGGYGGYGGGYGDFGEYGYGGYGMGMGAGARELSTMEELEDFLDEDDLQAAVVAYLPPAPEEEEEEDDDDDDEDDRYPSDPPGLQELKEAASSPELRGWVRFGYATAAEVLEGVKYKGVAVLVHKPKKLLSPKHEKPRARYPGTSLKAESLVKFIRDKATPLVGELSYSTDAMYKAHGKPLATLFTAVDHDKNPKGYTYYANRVRKVAEKHSPGVLFAIADKEEASAWLEDYGLELPGKSDAGVGIRSGDYYYKMEETFSSENFDAFVSKFIAGELKGKYKAPAAPPSYDDDDGSSFDGPWVVEELTDDNFHEVVSEDRDVMVEFFAPWCGHCKALKPAYNELATLFEDVPTVGVAAMDATAHEVPEGFDVAGYPTLVLVPAKGGAPIPYEGPRDADSMAKFIHDNAAISFEMPGPAGGEEL